MTYPADTTVSDGILANLLAAVTSIAPPDFRSTVATARVYDGNPFRVNVFPLAAIVPVSTKHDDSRLALIESTLDAVLVLCVEGTDWKTQISSLVTDARLALTNDYTRGGLAVTTQILEDRTYDATATENIAEAQIMFRVLYRTLYSDPTTPQ